MPAEHAAWRALRLRTGDPLTLVNVAPGGALVESARRLLPGTTVVLQVSMDDGTMTLRAEVTRCAVHALSSDRVQYRGALAFADETLCTSTMVVALKVSSGHPVGAGSPHSL